MGFDIEAIVIWGKMCEAHVSGLGIVISERVLFLAITVWPGLWPQGLLRPRENVRPAHSLQLSGRAGTPPRPTGEPQPSPWELQWGPVRDLGGLGGSGTSEGETAASRPRGPSWCWAQHTGWLGSKARLCPSPP